MANAWRNPREMPLGALAALGHEPMAPLKTIRAHCLDCQLSDAAAVRDCNADRCRLWPLRLGSSPWQRGATQVLDHG